MLMSQVAGAGGVTIVLARNEGEPAREVRGTSSLYDLALMAARSGRSLRDLVTEYGTDVEHDPEALARERRYLPPITHSDPAHLHLTGTGLTHLGSAATRDGMHQKLANTEGEDLTDSMRMFRMGLEGGKPANGAPGVQPEWFYKGNGYNVAAPGASLSSPFFAEDGGEEPEVAGIYVIGENGTPFRVGFALANEFSDHVMERRNYLYLAHSKLRPASFGPEILIGNLPDDIRGTSRIRRGGKVIFEKPFLTGEANMSHSIANLEHHHFKYGLFRQPGDLHIHMFGTATLSFADGVRTQEGDEFEIEAREFGLPLRNALAVETKAHGPDRVAVQAL